MFLERVTELIKFHGITKNKLLLELGINTNAFNNWEKRNTIPSGDIIAKIADYFHVSADYLLGRTDEKEPPTPVAGDGLDEKDIRLANWFRSLPPDKKKAILTLGEAPADLDE